MSVIVQQDVTMYNLLYFCKLLYMFRVVIPPIIRSTYNCNYGIWHWSNFGKFCVKSAKGERYGPFCLCYFSRQRKVAETVGPGSSAGVATGYGLDGLGIESRWGEIFRTCPDWLWGPPSILYNGYRVFPGIKSGRGVTLNPRPLLVPLVMKE
jgi:hypothetical protein